MGFLLRKKWGLSTYQTIALTFIALIAVGTLLLMLPVASVSGKGLGFLDALFTATSASCVTGLIVVDTGRHFTLFGQLVLICLIQLGGLGLMTIATIFSVAFGKKINLQDRLRIQESLNESEVNGVVYMCLRIVRLTLGIEFIFGSLLAWHLYGTFGAKGIYFGYWHAISAFCNAGFDLFGDFASLTNYVGDVSVNLIITTLIILGSIGFTVMEDVAHKRSFRTYRLHTKLVLVTTFILIVVGTVGFWVLENNSTLSGMTEGGKFLASYFQAITTRTAGFNSIDLASMRPATFMFMCILMFIGASPASTGGGVKTTTFAVGVMAINGLLHNKSDIVIFGRRIEETYAHRAFVIISLGFSWIVVATMLVAALENASLEVVLFEVVSAFATVGLSTGLSQNICEASKVIFIITMFAGRVGILTFAMALTSRRNIGNIRYPKEKIMVG